MKNMKASTNSADEARWSAVVDSDPTAAGAFVYAVKTTGIFCRPTCSSRLPKRQNVVFFDNAESASAAGFRPCKRCHPDRNGSHMQEEDPVTQACRLIEMAETSISLGDLASRVGMSQWHFHRLFKQRTGVTPKAYAAALKAKRLTHSLKEEASVTEALYEAGYSTSSRAYEAVDRYLGMTPSAYRDGAPGEYIRFAIAPCFLGWILVAATPKGICCIEFADSPEDASIVLREVLRERFPKARLEEAGPDFGEWLRIVLDFVSAPQQDLELPLDIQGTAFQQRVWKALQSIPAGETLSYSELAKRIGQPSAVRAVARACASNKIAVAIPCHRVIRSDGELSGYRWGVERKANLLAVEAQMTGNGMPIGD